MGAGHKFYKDWRKLLGLLPTTFMNMLVFNDNYIAYCIQNTIYDIWGAQKKTKALRRPQTFVKAAEIVLSAFNILMHAETCDLHY